MLPKAFISFAAEDAAFVDRVYRHLPHGQAMEESVSTYQLFVLFASKISTQKTWVTFEIERSRLARIRGVQKSLQVFPADSEITASDLPRWMQDFWFDRKARSARDVARLISYELNALAGPPLTEKMLGRGVLQDAIQRRFNMKRRELGGLTNPNIILASGVEQIGRETFTKNTLPQLYSGIPNIARGPILDLPTWADIKDVYRAIREIVEDPFDLDRFEQDLGFFISLDESKQVEELTRSLTHFDELGEAVIIRAPSFIYDQNGRLRTWVREWFQFIARKPSMVIAIVTNRQIPVEDEIFAPNVCQVSVGSIADDDIKLIIDDLSAGLGLKPHFVPPLALIQIGGHPNLARAYVRLVEQYGNSIFERTPTKFFEIQDGILQDNLDPKTLNGTPKTYSSYIELGTEVGWICS